MSLICCYSSWGRKREYDIHDNAVAFKKALKSRASGNYAQPMAKHLASFSPITKPPTPLSPITKPPTPHIPITKPPTPHSTPALQNKAATMEKSLENASNQVKSPALSRITTNVDNQADDFHSVQEYDTAYLSVVESTTDEAHTSYRTVKSNTSTLFTYNVEDNKENTVINTSGK